MVGMGEGWTRWSERSSPIFMILWLYDQFILDIKTQVQTYLALLYKICMTCNSIIQANTHDVRGGGRVSQSAFWEEFSLCERKCRLYYLEHILSRGFIFPLELRDSMKMQWNICFRLQEQTWGNTFFFHRCPQGLNVSVMSLYFLLC